MRGLMMETPLRITSILQFAERNHPHREIVSVTADDPLHRYDYSEASQRIRKLANALRALGINEGDRVATLAWNDYRHFEIYYAVSCSGSVCHTINPRLFEDQIDYIVNHAGDRWIFTDVLFVPLLEQLQDRFDTVRGFVVMTDEAHMPDTTLKNALCYETLLSEQSDEYDWPDLDENTAALLCYTSGTTGNPKGVLFSHRSTVLHAYAACLPDTFNFSQRDCVMPVVPLFHACGWGVPYAAPLVGAKLVLPGPKLADGERLHALIEGEGVTCALGVPTVWLALLTYLREAGKTVSSLERTVVGGAACPLSIMQEFKEKHGVHVHHAWGMTETSPLGTLNSLKADMAALSDAELGQIYARQGRGVFGIEMKITDSDDNELPWDGEQFGTFKVRGPWVCSGYYNLKGQSDVHDEQGWFDTGDVATIDPRGYMHITDRTKDVIKSGGEWISSIELENNAVGHPAVAEAAVIGIAHPKWDERPLLIVVKKDGEDVSKEELLRWYKDKVVKWWIPDDVVFVDELPHTATGKLNKLKLRKEFENYELPG